MPVFSYLHIWGCGKSDRNRTFIELFFLGTPGTNTHQELQIHACNWSCMDKNPKESQGTWKRTSRSCIPIRLPTKDGQPFNPHSSPTKFPTTMRTASEGYRKLQQ